MKAHDLVLRILQLRPNLPTTRLIKLCYLVDLAGIELRGAQISDISYSWHQHGPYSRDFEAAVWELDESQRIKICTHRTYNDYDCKLHSAIDVTPPEISDDEERIIEYIVRQYGSFKSDDLVNYAYSTPPMVKIQNEGSRFEMLDMYATPSEQSYHLSQEIAQMVLDSEADVLNGKIVQLEEFLRTW